MKQKLPVFIAVLFALSTAPEVFAQARGPRYNPPGGGGSSSSSSSRSSGSSSSSSSRSSSSSSSSSSSRGSSYNPPSRSSSSSSSSSSSRPSRPSSSSSSSSSSSTPRGPRYNPGSSTPSTPSRPSSPSSPSTSSTPRGPRYNPGSSTPSTRPDRPTPPSTSEAPRGPRYNPTPSTPSTPSIPSTPSTPRGPRYNPTPMTHRPGGIVVRRVTVHTPIVVNRPGTVIYTTPRAYYTHVSRRYVYRRWIQEPVIFTYSDGYYDMDGYPYYVHHGYRYRYNPIETCKYELVDGDNYQTVREYAEQACTQAYDTCAVERDTMNRAIGMERYFCAEAVDSDLEQQDTTTYQPTAVEITEAQRSAIEQFLLGKDNSDVFKAGPVGKCSIVKIGGLFSSGNKFGCKYVVKVSDKAFPLTDESICSEEAQAEAMECNVGTEKENAGCIMTAAIKAGYCL